MAAIADIVSYFGWSEVIAIFTDDDNSRNGVAALGDKLAEKRHKISYKAVLPPDPTPTREDVKKLLIKVRMMESRVIILHTFSKSGLLVFDVAKELGMMESGYVWIATTWLSTVLDSTSPLSSKTASSIQGALTLRPHTPDSKRKRDFISRWNELSNGTIGLNPYGLYAYDTVWMLAHAIDLLLERGGSIAFSNITSTGPIGGLKGGTLNLGALSIFQGGKQLLDNILRTNTTGLTGPVAFHPDRSLLNPSYEIINTNENGHQRTGYWSNYSGISLVPPEKLFNRSKANHSCMARRDNIEGYCIEIFVAAIKLLPYAVPYKFVLFGDGLKNPSYNELVNMVASGRLGFVVARKIVDSSAFILLFFRFSFSTMFFAHTEDHSEPSSHGNISSRSTLTHLLTFLSFVDEKRDESKRNKSKRKRNESVVPNVNEKEDDQSVKSASKRIQINNSQEMRRADSDTWPTR
ncbi:hypothetical protein C1H46_004985 [Malus baccata]|uniref:Receptor ligand binding region domain-containing protein n=1 Tax=Malus baccata TaxID=106549 RepID=A0A540NEN3_MALBA|nr:hypothetical protein C1H46_004985 [Malus baccata]